MCVFVWKFYCETLFVREVAETFLTCTREALIHYLDSVISCECVSAPLDGIFRLNKMDVVYIGKYIVIFALDMFIPSLCVNEMRSLPSPLLGARKRIT